MLKIGQKIKIISSPNDFCKECSLDWSQHMNSFVGNIFTLSKENFNEHLQRLSIDQWTFCQHWLKHIILTTKQLNEQYSKQLNEEEINKELKEDDGEDDGEDFEESLMPSQQEIEATMDQLNLLDESS